MVRKKVKKQESKKNLYLIIAITASLLLLIIVLFRSPNINSQYPAPQDGIENADISPIVGKPVTYRGTLPCADCEGIETDLVIYVDTENDLEGQFRMSELYVGRSEEPILTKGNYIKQVGTETDSEEEIYILNPDLDQSTYYLVVDDSTLEMLDSSMNKIESELNYTLTKVE